MKQRPMFKFISDIDGKVRLGCLRCHFVTTIDRDAKYVTCGNCGSFQHFLEDADCMMDIFVQRRLEKSK